MSFHLLTLLLTLILNLVSSKDGPLTGTGSIVNGQSILFKDRPYVAQLFIKKFVCGGGILHKSFTKKGKSILNQGIIITAAHCTVNANIEDITVRVGCNKGFFENCDEGGTYSVSRIIEHSKYVGRKLSSPDISLLVLTESIDIDDARELQLPFDNTNTFSGSLVDIVGYGEDGSGDVTDDLRLINTIPIITTTECNRKWGSVTITQRLLCDFESDTKSSCAGDSGGPVVLSDDKITLVGIISFGDSGCSPTKPSVNTRVSSFLPWIAERLGTRTKAGRAAVADSVQFEDTNYGTNMNGFAFKYYNNPKILFYIICVSGVLLCVLWLYIIKAKQSEFGCVVDVKTIDV